MWNGGSHHRTRTSNLCLFVSIKQKALHLCESLQCVRVCVSATRIRAASMHILIRSEAAEKQISRFFAKTCAIKMKHKVIVNNAKMDYKGNEKNKSAGCFEDNVRMLVPLSLLLSMRMADNNARSTSLCLSIGNTLSLASLTAAARAGGRGADSSMKPCVISRFIQAF